MKSLSAEQILQKNALRVTEPRLALLKALSGAHQLFTLEELHQKCGVKKIDFATVYRSIQKFLELGLVQSVELGDGQVRYELAGEGDDDHHHHHVLCKKCKRVEVVDLCGIAQLEKELKSLGYKDISHRLEFKALCKRCQ